MISSNGMFFSLAILFAIGEALIFTESESIEISTLLDFSSFLSLIASVLEPVSSFTSISLFSSVKLFELSELLVITSSGISSSFSPT